MEFEQAIQLIRSGDEIGYLSAIDNSKGFLIKIYNNKLKNILDYEEWESEALDVLVKSIRQYEVENDAKFSTYFYKGLNNKAIDLIRKHFGVKNTLNRTSISSEYLFDQGFEKTDDRNNDAISWMMIKEAVSKLEINTPLRKEAYLKLFNKEKIGRFNDKSIKRMHKTMFKEVRKYISDNKAA